EDCLHLNIHVPTKTHEDIIIAHDAFGHQE
ncbi:unnamed protein product, partial [Allacma fusca]